MAARLHVLFIDNALMDEHMNAMQGGIAMLNSMSAQDLANEKALPALNCQRGGS